MSRHEIERLLDEYGPAKVLSAILPFVSDDRLARIDHVLDHRLTSLTVVVENLYHPHNGAAAIRSIEAFGLSELWAIETVSRIPVSHDITIGADKWITLRRAPDASSCASALRERGFKLAATTPDAAIPFDQLPMSEKWAVWFGNERDGLTAEAIDLADERVAIPMHGFTRSFNISVSVALIVRELAALRRSHLGKPGDLERAERAWLRARFAATGIRGLSEIVIRAVSE